MTEACFDVDVKEETESKRCRSKKEEEDEDEHRKLPIIEIRGSSHYEVGFNYGELLASRIAKCFRIYHERLRALSNAHKVFQENGALLAWMKKCSETFMQTLQKHKHLRKMSDLMDEMKGIADGSNLDLWWIYFINARGEIFAAYFHDAQMHSMRNRNDAANAHLVLSQECTTILCKKGGVLAQNWDWLQLLQDCVVIVRINDEMLSMVEPGMLAKVGFNKYGVGCTINSLMKPADVDCNAFLKNILQGIPIHLVIKYILMRYKSVAEMNNDNLFTKLAVNRFIGIGVMDNRNNGVYVEFCGKHKSDQLRLSDTQFSFHTNHYLGCGYSMMANDDATIGSHFRFKQLTDVYKKLRSDDDNGDDNDDDVQKSKLLLTLNHNKFNPSYPIFRSWVESPKDVAAKLGTVCSVVMDLNQKAMHITRQKDANMIDTSKRQVEFDKILLS